ncbi:MAG: hypothetical protein AVDCRST_MAG89-4499, partial [uncultured Gemmatimonadetes bacterium]
AGGALVWMGALPGRMGEPPGRGRRAV